MKWVLLSIILRLASAANDEMGGFSMSSEEWDINGSPEFDSTETESIVGKSEADLDGHISKIQSSIDETDKLMESFDSSKLNDESADINEIVDKSETPKSDKLVDFHHFSPIAGDDEKNEEEDDLTPATGSGKMMDLFNDPKFQISMKKVEELLEKQDSKTKRKREVPAMPEAINAEIQNAANMVNQLMANELTTKIPESTVPTVTTAPTSWWDKVKKVAGDAGRSISSTVSNTVNTVSAWTSNATAVVKAWTTNTTKKAINATKKAFNATKNLTSRAWETTKNATENGWNSVKNMTKNGVTKLANVTKNGWAKTKNFSSHAWNSTKNGFGKLKNATKNGGKAAWNATKLGVGKLKNSTLTKLGKARNWTNHEIDLVKNSTIYGKLTNASHSGWQKVKNVTSAAWNSTKTHLGKLKNSTKNAMGKLKNSTKNGFGKLANMTKNGWEKVKNLTKIGVEKVVNETHEIFAPGPATTVVNVAQTKENPAQKFETMLKEKSQELQNTLQKAMPEAMPAAMPEAMPKAMPEAVPEAINQLKDAFNKPVADLQNQLDNTIAKAKEQLPALSEVGQSVATKSSPDLDQLISQAKQAIDHVDLSVIRTRSVLDPDQMNQMDQMIDEAQAAIDKKLSQSSDSVFGSIGPKVDPNGVNVMIQGIQAVDPQLMQNMMEAAKTLSGALMNFTQKSVGQVAEDGTIGNISQQDFKDMLIATQQSFQQLTQMLQNAPGAGSNGQVMHDIPSVTGIPTSQLEATLNNLTASAAAAVGNAAIDLDSALQDAQTALAGASDTDQLQAAIDKATAAIQAQMDALQAMMSTTMVPPTVAATTTTVGIAATTTSVMSPTNQATTTTTILNPATNAATTTTVAGPAAATTPMVNPATNGATTTTVVNPATNAATTTTVAAPAATTTIVVNPATNAATTTTVVNPATNAATTTTVVPGPTSAAGTTTTVSTTPERTQAPGELLPVPDFPAPGCVIPYVDPHSKVSSSAYQEMGQSDDCEGLCANMTMFPCQAYTWAGPSTYCMLHGPIDNGMVTIQKNSPYNITDYLCKKSTTQTTSLKLCVFAERGIQISMDLNVQSYQKIKAQSIEFCQQKCSLDTLGRCTSFAYNPTVSFFDGYNCVTFHRSLSLTQLPRGTFSLYENPCLLYS